MSAYTGWNYRLLRHPGDQDGEEWLAVHEVFYDETGFPCLASESPISPGGYSKEEFLDVIKRIQEATAKPTLDYRLFFAQK